MSTPKERKEFIEQQREDSRKYGVGHTKRVLGDMSFIDKHGNIVRPTRDNPFPTASGGSYGPVNRKKHYDSTRVYGTDGQNNRYHTYRLSGQDISGMMSILAICASIFFFSNNVTGNVIGLSNTTLSWIGGVLILIGVIAGFFYFKTRK